MTIKGKSHLNYNSYQSIKGLYYQYFTNIKPFEDSGFDNNESDKFSFSLQNYLYFYIEMHKLSGSSEWITLIEETCNHILDNTDERRVEKLEIVLTPVQDPPLDTNYFQAPFPYQRDGIPIPGWSSFDGSPRPRLRAQVLQDGQIIGAMCTAAHYIISNGVTSTAGFTDSVLSHSRRVIDSHDHSYKYASTVASTFIAGTYKYPERFLGEDSVYGSPVPYNHCGAMTKATLICHHYENNQDYLDKAQKFMDFTRDTRVEDGDKYFWNYAFTTTTIPEDFNHGSYSLDMMLMAYELGYLGMTKDELTKYANTVASCNKWPRVSEAFEKIDLSGDLPTGETFDIGNMAYLSEFNANVLTIGRDLSSTNYIAKYPSHFRSVATLLNNLEDWEL